MRIPKMEKKVQTFMKKLWDFAREIRVDFKIYFNSLNIILYRVVAQIILLTYNKL